MLMEVYRRYERRGGNRVRKVFEGSDEAPFGISFKKIIRGCSAKNHRPRKGRWGKGEEVYRSSSFGILSSSGNRGHVVSLIGLGMVAAWV